MQVLIMVMDFGCIKWRNLCGHATETEVGSKIEMKKLKKKKKRLINVKEIKR